MAREDLDNTQLNSNLLRGLGVDNVSDIYPYIFNLSGNHTSFFYELVSRVPEGFKGKSGSIVNVKASKPTRGSWALSSPRLNRIIFERIQTYPRFRDHFAYAWAMSDELNFDNDLFREGYNLAEMAGFGNLLDEIILSSVLRTRGVVETNISGGVEDLSSGFLSADITPVQKKTNFVYRTEDWKGTAADKLSIDDLFNLRNFFAGRMESPSVLNSMPKGDRDMYPFGQNKVNVVVPYNRYRDFYNLRANGASNSEFKGYYKNKGIVSTKALGMDFHFLPKNKTIGYFLSKLDSGDNFVTGKQSNGNIVCSSRLLSSASVDDLSSFDAKQPVKAADMNKAANSKIRAEITLVDDANGVGWGSEESEPFGESKFLSGEQPGWLEAISADSNGNLAVRTVGSASAASQASLKAVSYIWINQIRYYLPEDNGASATGGVYFKDIYKDLGLSVNLTASDLGISSLSQNKYEVEFDYAKTDAFVSIEFDPNDCLLAFSEDSICWGDFPDLHEITKGNMVEKLNSKLEYHTYAVDAIVKDPQRVVLIPIAGKTVDDSSL